MTATVEAIKKFGQPGAPHDVEHLRRIVIWAKEPASGRNSAYKMRSPEEAERELGLL